MLWVNTHLVQFGLLPWQQPNPGLGSSSSIFKSSSWASNLRSVNSDMSSTCQPGATADADTCSDELELVKQSLPEVLKRSHAQSPTAPSAGTGDREDLAELSSLSGGIQMLRTRYNNQRIMVKKFRPSEIVEVSNWCLSQNGYGTKCFLIKAINNIFIQNFFFPPM